MKLDGCVANKSLAYNSRWAQFFAIKRSIIKRFKHKEMNYKIVKIINGIKIIVDRGQRLAVRYYYHYTSTQSEVTGSTTL